MCVNQVGVGDVIVKCLIAVGDAFRYENCRARIDFMCENSAETVAFAQITPRAEYSAISGGDKFIPRLGMEAAGSAGFIVEADVVLHDGKGRESQCFHLFFLIIFFEPTAVVAVDGQFYYKQPGDWRFGDGEFVVI